MQSSVGSFNRGGGVAANGAVSSVSASSSAAGVNSPQSPSEPAKIRRENVMTELITTEGRYVQDLEEVLVRTYRYLKCQAFCFHAFSEDEVGFCL